MNIQLRKAATTKDFKAAHDLIYELAVYEKAPEEMINDLAHFIADGTSQPPRYQLTVAENLNDGNIVGIALYYDAYSTWKGRMVYLDDLVVTVKYRRYGIGEQLINAVFEYARNQKAQQVRWHVLDWNEPAINFYKKIKTNLEDNWITCKYEQHNLYPEPA